MKFKPTHGLSKTPTYWAWIDLRRRCNDKSNSSYESYGGRGITVCDRWANSFENFIADMGEKPSRGMSIDRIDVNGNYTPENCRWATSKEQGRNKRNNLHITIDEVTLTLPEWCERYNAKYWLVIRRIKKWNWTPLEALTTPGGRKGMAHVRLGEDATNSKLTADQVRAIRLDARKQKTIAEDYGIEQSNVSAIKRRKSWAHI